MRLINTTTLQLDEFLENQIPEYAILSHSWSPPKDEVSFKDMSTEQFKHKPGYQKILHFCKQASKDELMWAWCDTCCIDKDSSAELTEAINSMFRWYSDAKKCYAYLSDVAGSSEGFRVSRWFKKGWTLQELLAPEDVIFFASDWTYIGRKQTLYPLIRDITGINKGALESPWTIHSYSIATRISWAARRSTSRSEDRAYSLLGLLGVHMPLIYGEGASAFQRLQTELIKISDDESVFAHVGPDILASSPDAYVSGSEGYSIATPLPRSTQDKPYSITNMGLKIELPLIHPHYSRGLSFADTLGILNCHHVQDYSHYLAIHLRRTKVPNTLLRAPGPVELVDESLVETAAKTPVIILRRLSSVPKITCFFERVGFSLQQYKRTLVNLTTAVPWQFREDRLTLHRQPNRSVQRLNRKDVFSFHLHGEPRELVESHVPEYEMVVHHFTGQLDEPSFAITTIFELDLIKDCAGLLIATTVEHDALECQGHSALFEFWKNEGKLAENQLQLTARNGQTRTIAARIVQEVRLRQPIWVLSIEIAPMLSTP